MIWSLRDIRRKLDGLNDSRLAFRLHQQTNYLHEAISKIYILAKIIHNNDAYLQVDVNVITPAFTGDQTPLKIIRIK